MHRQLGESGVSASRLQVRRAYAELGLLRRPPFKQRIRTTNSRHSHPLYPDLVKGRKAGRPDEVWAADVTYFKVRRRFAHLALVMDVFTREILGWSVSYANDTALTLEALAMAKASGRSPEIHHSDRGSNYASGRYVAELLRSGARVSMTGAGCPQDNGHVERLNQTLKEEEIRWSEYLDLEDARTGIQNYVGYYNRERIHASLGYKRPADVFEDWGDQQTRSPLTTTK